MQEKNYTEQLVKRCMEQYGSWFTLVTANHEKGNFKVTIFNRIAGRDNNHNVKYVNSSDLKLADIAAGVDLMKIRIIGVKGLVVGLSVRIHEMIKTGGIARSQLTGSVVNLRSCGLCYSSFCLSWLLFMYNFDMKELAYGGGSKSVVILKYRTKLRFTKLFCALNCLLTPNYDSDN